MVNLMGAVQIASAAEGMVLAERAGLDLKLVADAVGSGQAASPQVVRNVRRFVAGDHSGNVNFTPALRLKDIDYALRLAKKSGVECAFGEVAADIYRKLCEQGFGATTKAASSTRCGNVRTWSELRLAQSVQTGASSVPSGFVLSRTFGLARDGAQQHAPGRAAIGAWRDVRRRPRELRRRSAAPDAAREPAR